MEKPILELEEYRKADLNKRLHLFLQFPNFRREFLKIDMKEESVDTNSPDIWSEFSKRIQR